MGLLALNRFAAGDFDYTEDEIDTLHVLAHKCPYIYGSGVYMARLMLVAVDSFPTFYVSECESPVDTAGNPSPRLMNPYNYENSNDNNSTDISAGFKLYPNPNDGNMYIEYKGLAEDAKYTMYDMMGRRIAYYDLLGEEGKITISEVTLGVGIYLYRISNNDKTFETGKIVIQK